MQKLPLLGKKKPFGIAIFTLFFTALFLAPSIATAGFGVGFSPVLSQSMSPAFNAGDLQITKMAPIRDVAVGDVILVRDEESFATFSHRIALKEFSNGFYSFTLKGDSNPTADRAKVVVPAGVTIPKVIGRIPKIGSYVNTFSGSTAKRTLIGFLIFLIGLSVFRFALGARNKNKEK